MAECFKHILVHGCLAEPLYEDFVKPLEKWFEGLVEAVNMNILVAPSAVWCDTIGNEGITGSVIIDTSHASIHIWNTDEPFFKFDLFSCKDYDVDTVIKELKKLNTTRVTYCIIDRDGDQHIVTEQGFRQIKGYHGKENLS